MARLSPAGGAAAPAFPTADGGGSNPYNAGWQRAADPRGRQDDCPFLAPLVERERAEWLRGFAAGRGDD